MWNDLWVALALVLVVEGLLPALNPRGYRRMLQLLGERDDRLIRNFGLLLMIVGAIALYFLKS
ncbi:MAG: DUF2065 domain-containing protein [Gammaproteobacteria bacterium]|nr:DUF2065 domain-containing protein [Gammaproteobacteria bacterium]